MMKAKNEERFRGRCYIAVDGEAGSLPCVACVAVDGLKHDWDLCEALMPCSQVNRDDGRNVIWADNGPAAFTDQDRADLIKAIRYGSTAAVMPQPSSWCLQVIHAEFRPLTICQTCMVRLTELYYEHNISYTVSRLDAVSRCECCGDGGFEQMTVGVDMAKGESWTVGFACASDLPDRDAIIKAYNSEVASMIFARWGSPALTLHLPSTPRDNPNIFDGLMDSLRADTCTALVVIPKRWVIWFENNPDLAEQILCDQCLDDLQSRCDKEGVDYHTEWVPGWISCRSCKAGIEDEILHDFKFMLEEVL